jgi:hypothetical protein
MTTIVRLQALKWFLPILTDHEPTYRARGWIALLWSCPHTKTAFLIEAEHEPRREVSPS